MKVYAIFVTFPDGTSSVSTECFAKLSDAKKLLAERTDEVQGDGWRGTYVLGGEKTFYKIRELTVKDGDK